MFQYFLFTKKMKNEIKKHYLKYPYFWWEKSEPKLSYFIL